MKMYVVDEIWQIKETHLIKIDMVLYCLSNAQPKYISLVNRLIIPSAALTLPAV